MLESNIAVILSVNMLDDVKNTLEKLKNEKKMSEANKENGKELREKPNKEYAAEITEENNDDGEKIAEFKKEYNTRFVQLLKKNKETQ